jgi:hypothetical protein
MQPDDVRAIDTTRTVMTRRRRPAWRSGFLQGKTRALIGIALVGLAVAPQRALAWGATGHRLISSLAASILPEEIPVFLRNQDIAWQLGELGREPDRSKGSGAEYDGEHSPGHYMNVGDDRLVAGGPRLMALPATRQDFDSALRERGTTQYVYGYLPYAIVDGWQQLRKDFGYWRVAALGERTAATPEDRAWFARDRKLRELLITRDLGAWSHFVGDASQPMHVSVHYNGWGLFANPHGYSQAPLHGWFEGDFVRQNVQPQDVMAKVASYWSCGCPIEKRAALYLAATLSTTEPFYALEQAGGFKGDGFAGRAFAAERLAAAVSELRDLVVEAWRASPDADVGFPPVKVRDIEAGKAALPLGELKGLD